ncbi:MAG TPA: sensor domain-containing diguanylate cyclase [Acidimicrobiales bacterium]|nr:sensor domain-containing diguanylate cyclase [Acidimicrobiales bacterium]
MVPLCLSIALVFATGGLGIALSNHANAQAEAVLRADRETLQSTLASLGKQYVLFSLKEGLDYASTGTWALTPNDLADQARLQSFVTHAVLLNYGAALVTLSGQPLTSYAAGPGLPPSTDPGYRPMVSALLAGRPNTSSVMKVGGVDVVAMAVPVTVAGQNKALFIGYVRLDRSALETYVEQLHFARTGQVYVVDSTGTVVAATRSAAIGTHLAQPQALAALGKDRSGFVQDAKSGTASAYAPFGIGGWGGLTVQSSSEFFGPIRSGHLRIELGIIAVLAMASAIILVLGYKQEIVRRRFQEQLAHQAYHDGLTALANRELFQHRLAQALARAKRQSSTMAVLYLDLDGLKPVNDSEGHEIGDALLVHVANRLLGIVRTEDTVARMGGDEFAILMEDLDDTSGVISIASRIVEVVSTPVVLNERRVRGSVSVGIAFSHSGRNDAETLLRDADLAMYRAKESGKNGYMVAYDPAKLSVPVSSHSESMQH